MKEFNRRNFLRLAAGSGAVVATGVAGTRSAFAGSVKITEGIIPGVLAISNSLGRKYSGRYGSDKGNPIGDAGGAMDDRDYQNKWWKKFGKHPNAIIPNWSDPVSGAQRWMDTVVRVVKA